jgi:acetyl-CoA synthetase
MAYVSLRPGVEPTDELREELASYAREQLSKHEYPREIEFLDELPKTATGKVRRSTLEERARETAGADRPGPGAGED